MKGKLFFFNINAVKKNFSGNIFFIKIIKKSKNNEIKYLKLKEKTGDYNKIN
jgi:hypothetical protein